MLSIAQAETNPCKEIVERADRAIEARDQMIDLMAIRYNRMIEDQYELQQAFARNIDETQSLKKDRYTYGLIGFAIGVITTSVVLGTK